jgi:hypothetical protein
MKKLLLILFLLACCGLVTAQSRFRTSAGEIRFNASTPLEDIDAVNNKVNAIINAETGDFAVVLLIKDFSFRRKLMQEHFNENFMESATYPKAYYSGKITGFSAGALSAVPMKLRVAGELTIHGVSRTVETMASLSKNGDTIRMTSEFIAKPEDYKIKVPRILFNKIAEEVKVMVNLELMSGNQAGG